MQSITATVRHEQTIQKSRFLTHLIPVRHEDDVAQALQDLRDQYPDATHHCYAYVIGDGGAHQKYGDDGEPHRTAGLPMLEVLLKQGLTDILAVVIRYYGGIKLGAGGLVRAYGSSVALCLDHATFASKRTFLRCAVTIDFDLIGRVESWLRSDYTLLDTTYGTGVSYHVELPEEAYDVFLTTLSDRTRGQVAVNVVERSNRYVANKTSRHTP